MSTEQVNISQETESPTLEESAEALGLDPVTGDPVPQEEVPALPEVEAERPEWLPEKFDSAEALAEAYAALEAKQSAPAEEAEADEATPESSEGFDLQSYSDKYFETGGLEDADFEALEAQGLSRDIVQQYIDGIEAMQAVQKETMLSHVGGEEVYNDMIEWASDNYSDAEIDGFNSIINGGDVNATRMAIEALKSRYDASGVNSEPTRSVSGDVAGAPSAYRSVNEMMADMQDPRYHADPAFRADVQQKLSRSDIL